jgi:hypothetical protein
MHVMDVVMMLVLGVQTVKHDSSPNPNIQSRHIFRFSFSTLYLYNFKIHSTMSNSSTDLRTIKNKVIIKKIVLDSLATFRPAVGVRSKL